MFVLINPNSTAAMTAAMTATARTALPGRRIEGWTSDLAPPAIQGPEDGARALPLLLGLVDRAVLAGAKAIVIGCADDIGLEEARARAPCPVLGIGQAGYALAALAGRFSVITTLPVSVPILRQNVQALGFGAHLGRVRASGVPVLALEQGDGPARVEAEARRALAEDGVQSLVLGCAGMSVLAPALRRTLGARIIDGVAAAAQLADTLARHEQAGPVEEIMKM